jgi:hypothetical protein
VVVVGDTADALIRRDGSISESVTGRVGASKGTPGAGNRAAVFVFQLPAPGPGETAVVDKADFQFTITADQLDGAYNIDLYGLAARAQPTVLETDNFFGQPLPNGPSLIQDDIIPKVNTLTGAIHPNTLGLQALAKYLNDQYGPGGLGAGGYVFLRLNPDQDPPIENSGVDVAFANNANAALRPQLTITFMPEPNLAAAGVAVVGLAVWRRRRRG